MPGERLVKVGKIERKEEKSMEKMGEGMKTMSRSVKAEEASPGLDLRV